MLEHLLHLNQTLFPFTSNRLLSPIYVIFSFSTEILTDFIPGFTQMPLIEFLIIWHVTVVI